MSRAHAEAVLQMMRRRRAQGEPLSPREREDALWLWTAECGCSASLVELLDLFSQDLEPMLMGVEAQSFSTIIRAVEADGGLDPWDADRLIERTVWR